MQSQRSIATPEVTVIKQLLLLLFGLILFIVAAVLAIRTTLFLLDAERATATVTAVRSADSTCRKRERTRRRHRHSIETRYDCTVFTANLEYQTNAGQQIDFKRGAGSVRGHGQPISRARYAATQTVGVLYRPDRPNEPYLDTFIELWGGSLLTAIAGFIFTIFGLVSFSQTHRGSPEFARRLG